MNRVVKTAFAVTVFGLAAAVSAVPAQAEVLYHAATYVPADDDGEGTSKSAGGGPLDLVTGLLGGVGGSGGSGNASTAGGALSGIGKGANVGGGSVGGGSVGGGLLGGLLGGLGQVNKTGGQAGRTMTEEEKDTAAENQAEQPYTPNAAEDVTSHGGPIPELTPIVSSVPLGGGGLTEALPVLGAARLAEPGSTAAKAGKQRPGQLSTETFDAKGTVDTAAGLAQSSLGGAVGQVPSTGLLPGGAGTGLLPGGAATGLLPGGAATGLLPGGASVTGQASYSTMAGSGAGFSSASEVTQAAKRALPYGAMGQLSPVLGHVAPAEMSPVIQTLPGTTQAATVNDLAPLVEDASGFVAANGTQATGAYGDLMTALGWTTDALTSSVQDSWSRD